ncbi:MAG: SusC/RagA family TonB-linked outer membrane protein [Flavisolibacter sp.]
MRKTSGSLLLAMCLLITSAALAQSRVPVKQALDEVTRVFGTRFVYEHAVIEGKTTTVNVAAEKGKPVQDVLKAILYPHNLLFLYVDDNHYTIVRDDNKTLSARPNEGVVEQQQQGVGQQSISLYRSVTGVVTDPKGMPLSGVSVVARRSGNGTSTDVNGRFTIQVNNTDVLVISSVGYDTEEMNITDQDFVRVVLNTQESELKSVVVVAYGTQAKKDVTGSVSQISGRELSELPPTINVEQGLQGRAAGVMVVQESGQPGSATRVRIRGSSSLLGSNQPLYVVDGIPVVAEGNIPDDGSAFNRALLQQGLSSPLGNISPDDIESISVLKDASATAIYGSRAANGVVIISTKKGRGKPTYNFSSSLSYQKAQTENVLNADQFREIWTEAANNSTSTAAIVKDIKEGRYFGTANTNWAEEVTPADPLTKNLNFSIGGSTDKLRYYTALSSMNQTGSFENSYFNRYSFVVNLNLAVSSRLNLGTSLNLSSSKQGSPDASLLTRIYSFRPDLPVYDADGNYSFSDYHNFENPVALATASNVNKTALVLGSIFGELKIANDFSLKSSLALNYNNGKQNSFYPRHTFTGGFSRSGLGLGYAQESTSEFVSTLWENTMDYRKRMGRHFITGVLGASWQGDHNEYLKASGKGFPQDVILTNLSSATQDFTVGGNSVESGLISYFGRVNYQYDDKYLLTLSARTDGSSKFAEENKWAFFPTVAAGWRISEEKFMQPLHFINDLKLRASVGVTGQQNFGAYQWRTLFDASSYGGQPAVVQSQLGNSRLKWELTRQTDLGLDFSLFNNRLNGAVDLYEKNTSDLLYFFKTPGNTGYATVIGNLGSTQNRGIELSLDADVLKKKDFTWNVAFNVARNRNKLVKLNDDYLNAEGYIIPPNTGSRLKVGEPIGLIYGYEAEGIFQTQSEIDKLNSGAAGGVYQASATAPGDIRFKDLDGDGKVTSADQTIIGNTLPDFSGGFTNSFDYKGLRLSALFTYSKGNDIRWGTQSTNINFTSPTYENKLVTVLDRWTPQSPSTTMPRVVYGDPNGNSKISSFYVHDASYLRLKNLYLSYSLPAQLMSRTGFLKSSSVFLSGTNLFTVTKYPGANPETSNLYNDDVSSGLDNSRFPISKVYTLGVKVGF